MAIIESTATALVRFTGLGIIVFNEEKQRGEIGIIRDEKHQLSIKIQEPRFKDGVDKDIIVYEDIAVYQDLQKKGVKIEIITAGNSAINGYQTYQADGEFNRLESDDTNDFRWLVSLKNLHSEKMTAAKGKNRYPISKLFIENGLFYVHKLDTNLFFEKIEKDADGSEKNREMFGNVAETIGVKLESDEVSFKITIANKEEIHNFTRSNFPYRIEIKNMNYDEDAAISDMPDYYKYIESEINNTFELSPVADETNGVNQGGQISTKDFCHPIEGGGFDFASIEDLEG
jgi:hypothetical protein